MKKYISLCLAVCLLVSVPIAGAAKTDNNAQIQALLAHLDIMVGDTDGSFHGDDFVTRAEFTKVAVMASAYRNAVPETSTTSPFGDAPYTLWSAPYITLGVDNNLLSGYPDSTFRPENPVLLEEGVTICLKLLGYSEADYGKVWPSGPMSLAKSLDLLENIEKSTGSYLQRTDVMHLIYNTLNCKTKSGIALINGLNYTYLEDTTLLATQEQDKSLGKNKISTSAGTYKIGDYLDISLLGRKGDAFIKNGDTLEAFIPNQQRLETHAVYSAIGNDLVVYKNGTTEILSLDSNMVCYSGSKAGTVATNLSSVQAGDTVKIAYDADGEMDYLVHTVDDLKGPYTVYSTAWQSANGIAEDAAVIKNGKTVSADSVDLYDVVYYAKDLNLVWVYADSITGTYEKAQPNQDSPTSVVISGNTLSIESATAFSKLSSSGSCKLGDTLTVLLGRNGGIADVLTGENTTVQYGLLTETGTRAFDTSSGNMEYAYYAKIVTAAGKELEFKTDTDYDSLKNQLVTTRVSDGKTKLSRVNTDSGKISGTFKYSTMTLGGESVAENVKILDIIGYEESGKSAVYTTVYPQRLDAAALQKRHIIYTTRNEKNEIDSIFLDDVTGDACLYGVITDAEKISAGMNVSGKYTVNVGGTSMAYNSSSVYPVSRGSAVKILKNGNSISSIQNLNDISKKITKFDKQYAYAASGEKYALGDGLAVYKHTANTDTYHLIDLEDLDTASGSIQCFYNNTLGAGGRIRVIIWTV